METRVLIALVTPEVLYNRAKHGQGFLFAYIRKLFIFKK